jgi:hypothetical protein
VIGALKPRLDKPASKVVVGPIPVKPAPTE